MKYSEVKESSEENKKYELLTVHAQLICTLIENQIDSIEKELQREGDVLTEDEKTQLVNRLRARCEALDPILKILNAGGG
jgi:hypothetical protein